jgi:hypothetical protein
MGVTSARRLARAAMAGGRWSGWWDCCASASVGVAAAAAAEVRRKRRRLSMGAISVLGKFASEAIQRGYSMNAGHYDFFDEISQRQRQMVEFFGFRAIKKPLC